MEEILSSIEFHLNEVPELAAIQQAGLGCEEEYTECAMLASLFLINNYPSSRKGRVLVVLRLKMLFTNRVHYVLSCLVRKTLKHTHC